MDKEHDLTSLSKTFFSQNNVVIVWSFASVQKYFLNKFVANLEITALCSVSYTSPY